MKSSKKQEFNQNLKKPTTVAHFGTSGFRYNTPDLKNIICRASLIAYIRSATFAGKFIGIYITASHNPVDYNGIKFIDFNGNMLDEVWENAADELVNCEDSEFQTIIKKLFRQNSNYSGVSDSIYGNVVIARDTRDSGEFLIENIKDVFKDYRVNIYDYEIASCPEMHFLIKKCNERNEFVEKESYINHLIENYNKLRSFTEKDMPMGIDTANGVACIKIAEIVEQIPDFQIEILNQVENPGLNQDCGADYVKTRRTLPKVNSSRFELSASFDGDADRLVFFTQSGKIFDGDAQCAFIAEYIKNLIDEEKIECNIGVVLSHYSNMGVSDYLKKQFNVVLAQAGVKNFIKEAKKFDIGIYFEPNGHGSVFFSKKIIDKIENSGNDHLKALINLFEPCVGDAISNFLFFKSVLGSAEDFTKYKENPSRLLTVKIIDKNEIKVDQNNVVVEPNIQRDIDQLSMIQKGWSFVRPSGTEDLVRVYAEAPNEIMCDKLALNVAQLVYDRCGGIGPHPEISYNNVENK